VEDRKSSGITQTQTEERDPALNINIQPESPDAIPAPIARVSKRARLSHQAWVSMHLYCQPSRAKFVERRQEESNPGVIKLYCKLCQRLIVASRDEFVLPIAVKAHKCGDLRKRRVAVDYVSRLDRGLHQPLITPENLDIAPLQTANKKIINR
jgi:hypothetical protein